MITTLDEALEVLRSYIPKPGLMHHNYKLERMGQLMDLLDNPQNAYKVVHVAGTSGKTSTSYFIRGLLQTAGQKTGLTVSPHIQSITERIQINGDPISDEKFIAYLNQLLEKISHSDIHPTYFELLMALAYMVFRDEKVDYAVIETGLGGLLDATNVITRSDKLCVITDIGLDHTEVLGQTVQEIALQKSGIVQPGNTLVLQHQDALVEQVIINEAKVRGSGDVLLVPSVAHSDHLPVFQRRNWAAAAAAYDVIAMRDGLPAMQQLDTHEAMLHQPPGRMELFQVHGKTVILDGAHNPQKLHALVESLQEKNYSSLSVLVSFVSSKHDLLDDSLRELRPIVDDIVVTDFTVMRDVGKSASLSGDIVAAAHRVGYSSVTEISDPRVALGHLLASSAPVVLVTGSLYLVAQIRDVLLD